MDPSRRLFTTALIAAPGAVFAQARPGVTVAEYILVHGQYAVFEGMRLASLPGKRDAAGWLMLVRRAGTPGCLLSACNDLGLATVRDVINFAQQCTLSYTQVDGLLPGIQLDMTLAVPWSTLAEAAGQQFTLAGAGDPASYRADHMHNAYVRLPLSKIHEMAARFAQREADYHMQDLSEGKVWALRGWLAAQGYGNAAVGLAGLLLYHEGRFVRERAVACALDTHDRFWLIDGLVHDARFCQFPGSRSMSFSKLAHLSF